MSSPSDVVDIAAIVSEKVCELFPSHTRVGRVLNDGKTIELVESPLVAMLIVSGQKILHYLMRGNIRFSGDIIDQWDVIGTRQHLPRF